MVDYRVMVRAVVAGDAKAVTSIVEKALNVERRSPVEIIEKGLTPGMEEIGRRFAKGEAFLVDLIVASHAFKKAMELVRPHFEDTREKIGTAVMGTVEGDIHDLGKNLVCVALEVNGFDVVDLGNDVKSSSFSSAARSSHANVLGMSTLITTTMVNMKKVIDRLVEDGIRGQLNVICGGAPVDGTYAKEIGADLYGKNAFEGVGMLRKALKVP